MSRNRYAPRAPAPAAAASPDRTRAPAVALCAMAVLVGTALAPAASAAEYGCSIPGDERHLRLELPGEDHLCEVSVSYLETGERRVMWYADNDSGFCSERLEELRAKYEGQWGFDCTRWPDTSGVDALDPARRAALDAELRRRRANLDGAERLVGVRVDRGAPDEETPLHTTEFFVRAPDGEVRTALVVERDGRVVARTEDLAGSLATGDVRVRDVRVDSIGIDGAVRVATTLSVDGAACRGSQSLRADADGVLVPGTPHRFVCEVVQASGSDAIR